jgi:hypothetical protein
VRNCGVRVQDSFVAPFLFFRRTRAMSTFRNYLLRRINTRPPIIYRPHQRRWARVQDVRYLATHGVQDRITDRYRDKLDRKAQEWVNILLKHFKHPRDLTENNKFILFTDTLLKKARSQKYIRSQRYIPGKDRLFSQAGHRPRCNRAPQTPETSFITAFIDRISISSPSTTAAHECAYRPPTRTIFCPSWCQNSFFLPRPV